MLHRLHLIAFEPVQGLLIEFCKDFAFGGALIPEVFALERLSDAFSLFFNLSHKFGNVCGSLCSGISQSLRSSRPRVAASEMCTILMFTSILISLFQPWLLPSRLTSLPVARGCKLVMLSAAFLVTACTSASQGSLAWAEILHQCSESCSSLGLQILRPLRMMLLFEEVHRPLKD